MDVLIRTTLQTLATHYKVDPSHIVDLLLGKEVLVLQNLTDFKRPGSLQELHRTIEKRDPKVTELTQLLLTKMSDLDIQIAGANHLLLELQRMRAFLQKKHPEVIPPAG